MTSEPSSPIQRLFAASEDALPSPMPNGRRWSALVGEADVFDLRTRLLLAFCAICAVGSLLMIPANLATGVGDMMQVFSAITAAVYALSWAIVRRSLVSPSTGTALVFAISVTVLVAYWFLFGGYRGAGPILMFGLMWFPFIARSWAAQVALLAAVAGLTASLYVVELLLPGIVSPWYTDETTRVMDLAASSVLGLTMCGTIFLALGQSYRQALHHIAQERARAEALLGLMLPQSTLARLRQNPTLPLAVVHDDATVLFADVAGFTSLAEHVPPEELLQFLHDLFDRFDTACRSMGVEKVKTIGDAYMAVAGVTESMPDHADRVLQVAERMRTEAAIAFQRWPDRTLGLRIGIHSGPLVAGVLSRSKVAFDLWGDTVNVASRMESQGVIGRIQLSEATRARLATATTRGEEREGCGSFRLT